MNAFRTPTMPGQPSTPNAHAPAGRSLAARPTGAVATTAATLLIALLLALLLAPPALAQSWTDLTPSILNDYGITAVEVGGISDGYSDGTWRPYDDMTRAQFVKMAVERFGLPLIESATQTFRDVASSHQFYSYVETAYRAGMIEGIGDGYFAPARTIDRAQGAAIIVRYLADLRGTTTEDLYGEAEINDILAPFQEDYVTIGPALADEVAAAVDWGILQGTTENQLLPRRQLARIQGAALLIRAPDEDIQETQVTVFFVRDGDVAAVHRTVTIGPAAEVGAAALEQLFAGPTTEEAGIGMSTAVPAGTQLIGLSIENGVATVDLDSDFTAPVGDQLSEVLRLAQVVYTLSAFRTVDTVHFHVAGQTLATFGGVDLDPPIGRSSGVGHPFEDVTPAVLVESPAPFDAIASPVRVRGSANTFEAVFQLEILDGNDDVLGSPDFVMATSGTGDRGTFDVTVPFSDPPTPAGELVVYELSAQDGTRTNEVRIPVAFR